MDYSYLHLTTAEIFKSHTLDKMFFKEVNEIDLGETTIANIFIDIFMPMANGLYVKVYLLGYRQACDPSSNPKFDNSSIAKNLIFLYL